MLKIFILLLTINYVNSMNDSQIKSKSEYEAQYHKDEQKLNDLLQQSTNNNNTAHDFDYSDHYINKPNNNGKWCSMGGAKVCCMLSILLCQIGCSRANE
jgi:hypothetical protein